ncbi:hypothetical protein G6F56_002659 [Rhizopus delemar]|nr:hypothetical protein G6F56_002659 [Rhizopus delemar]
MKEEGKQKVLELASSRLAENKNEGNNPPPRQTIFNNYGTVGAQGVISGGTFSVQSRKRAATDTSEDHTKKKRHLASEMNDERGEEGEDEDEFNSIANILDDIQSFPGYTTKPENDLSSMHVIDLSDTTSVNLLQQTSNQDTYNEIKNACAIKTVSLTKECNDFTLHLLYSILIHSDDPFSKPEIMRKRMNPIGQKLRERTAATWNTFPIINSLFLQYQDLIEFKWIEVLHDDLESRGCHTNTEKNLESDCFKIYKNAIKTLKKDNKKKVYIVVYHDNIIFFESLTEYNQYYVRERHLKLTMPQNPRDLKSFAALLPTLLSWRQAAVDLAE